jgi:hypothetical protein
MKLIEDMEFHPITEEVVKILQERTQNFSPLFFRVSVAYYFAKLASMMRTTILTHDRGDIPVSMYALNLGTSGSGKGFSTNIMEEHVIKGFRERYLTETFPYLVELNLPKLAVARANRKNANLNGSGVMVDPDKELERVQKEFNESGTMVFSFDSGTTPAVKQLRHLLLMAGTGSINLEIDEIGSNLLANTEVMTAFLELYDKGLIKPKLIKSTADNRRNEEIVGGTPTNMLLFGTPAKLLDGGKVEEELFSMLETGYARRCFFGYSRAGHKGLKRTAKEVYDMLTNPQSNQYIDGLSDKLAQLADVANAEKKLVMTEETSLILLEYKILCEEKAEDFGEHEEIKKAEMSHRYFKALKLAGAYAFIDDCGEVTEEHLYNAIKLAEESGEAFHSLLTRDKPYVKLAKYFATCKADVTHADLIADLPFFKGNAAQRQELITLATAWGYRNNIIIKKAVNDGIDFLRGESLKESSLDSMIISYSTDIALNYQNVRGPFDELHMLTQADGHHWVAHHLVNGETGDGHRKEENCLPGFNLIVLDVDGGTSIETVRLVMGDYKYLLYTTKSHDPSNPQGHCFRLILPANYELNMTAPEYKEFMENIYSWLPFKVDEATNQRARKWLSWNMHYEYNEGNVLDVLPFIPKTSKNEQRKQKLESQAELDNLERWVINSTGDGNRNNMLLRYAMILVDAGYNFGSVNDMVLAMNAKLPDKLDDAELHATVLKTVANKMTARP